MGEEIVLKREDLGVLNEQFGGLGEKIKAGEYVIEASRTGERRYEESYSTTSHYSDDTVLNVTVRPSETNTAATIKSMSFEFKHCLSGSQGCFGGSEMGEVQDKFRIEAASGKSYVYGPKPRDINDYEDATEFLREVRSLGINKIQTDENAKRQAAWEKEQAAKKQQAQAKTTSIKNDIKF